MQVDVVHPQELTLGEIACWRRLQQNEPELFSSPYLSPDWAQAVGRVRRDARIAVFRDEGRTIGFLPVLRPDAHAALPMGAPVCDYQGLIGPANATFDLGLAAHALDVGRIDFTAGLKASALDKHLHTEDHGHVVRFGEGWDAYCAERQAAGSKTIARARKKLAKLGRELAGKVEIDAFSTDVAALDQLLAWKRQQYARTGVADIFDQAWIANLVQDCFTRDALAGFGGAMFVLRVDGAPIAGLFCLRQGPSLHAWFVAHDPAYCEHSPGLILFVEAIRAAANAGFAEMDLGPGDYRFKESLANAKRAIGSGFIGRPSTASVYRAAQFHVRAIVERMPVGRARHWPAKAMRRLDIARGLSAANAA